MLPFRRILPMASFPKSLRATPGILVGLLLLASPALAGGKPVPPKPLAPVVPGFTRFYANDTAHPTEGGLLLFATLNCTRCHAAREAPPADASLKTAPNLDGVGGRVKRSYLRDFLNDPHSTKPGTTMPNLFAGLDEDDRKSKVEALVHLLASTGTPGALRPDRKGINAGRDLYAKVGCVACHGTRDVNGDQEKLFATSVPLGSVKAKYTLSALKGFLANPHLTRPHGRMPGLLNDKEAGDVANYLLQGSVPGASASNMKYEYYEGAWKSLPNFAKLNPKATGQAADFEISVARRVNNCALKFDGYLKIETEGNYTFHLTSDDGSKLWIADKVVVNNDGVHPPAHKEATIKLAKGMHKLTLAVFNAGGGFELSAEVEGPGIARQPLGALVYLSDKQEPAVVEGKKDAENFAIQPELVAKGKELFVSMGCANCHQLQNIDKRLNAPVMADLKPAGGCVDGAPKKGIPWYGLSAVQQASLRAVIKKPWSSKVAAKESVSITMKFQNCYACHERDKIGGVEDELNKHFQTVMPEMGDEGRIPPSLTGVGAKMKPAYLKKVLEEGSHDRPYMHTRMPKFGSGAAHIPEDFISLDTPEKAPKAAVFDPPNKAKFAGRHMVGPQAFGCIKCHTFAGNKAEGVQGIDLAIMTERLNRDWFYHYMLNPNKYRPGTRMPTSFPDGQTLLKNVLDGKADTQIEAIWVYLADGKTATVPLGMNKSSIPLIPITEAIIYRNFIKGAGNRGIAVGFPERAHLAFDANDIRLAMLWQGGFIDAKRHWTGRGEGAEGPLGDNILNLPTGVSFFVLAKDDEAWPTKPAKELGYKFKGYRLTDDQRPTFLYSFNEINIEDAPNAVDAKGTPTIRRSFTITTDNPIDKLYYRAMVANQIDVEARGGWYRINDAWRMRIEADAPPIVRKSGGKMELLIPIRFKGNSAKLVQEYQW